MLPRGGRLGHLLLISPRDGPVWCLFDTFFTFGSYLLTLRLNQYNFCFATSGWNLSNDRCVRQVEIKIPALFLRKLDDKLDEDVSSQRTP